MMQLFEVVRVVELCVVLLGSTKNVATVKGDKKTMEGVMDRVMSTLLVKMDSISNGSGADISWGHGGVCL